MRERNDNLIPMPENPQPPRQQPLTAEQQELATAKKKIETEGFSLYNDKMYIKNERDIRAEDDTGTSSPIPQLTNDSFESPLAKRVWELLPESQRGKMLVDFLCTACVVERQLGISSEELTEMPESKRNETMKSAIEKHQEAAARGEKLELSQIDDIVIHFSESTTPGETYGKKTLIVSGTCSKCGNALTRTMLGSTMEFVNAIGRLFGSVIEAQEGQKIGRNDPCPCGSGLKYKKCCGKNA